MQPFNKMLDKPENIPSKKIGKIKIEVFSTSVENGIFLAQKNFI